MIRLVFSQCLALWFGASAAQAFGACSDAGYLAAFEVTGPPQPCDPLQTYDFTVNGDDVHLRVITLAASAHGDDPAITARIADVFQRVLIGMEALGPTTRIKDVTILLSDQQSFYEGQEVLGIMTGVQLPDECPVVLFKTETALTAENWAQTLAHELFHCVQDATWPAQYRDPAAKWWSEGSAEFFGALVVPESEGSAGFIADFDLGSVDHALFVMQYENVVFFDWLFDTFGPEALAPFIASLPAGSGDQLGAVQGQIGQEQWVEFVKSYLSGALVEPGGRPIPAPTYQGHADISDSASDAFVTDAYEVYRHDLTFAAQGRYEITFSGADLQAQIKLSDGEWQDLPQTISTCDSPQNAQVYAVTTTGPASGVFDITRLGDGVGDCCLVGTWEATQATLEGFGTMGFDALGAMAAAQGATVECAYAEGNIDLVFGNDGSGSIDFVRHTTQCTTSFEGETARSTGTRNGSQTFGWHAGQGGVDVDYGDFNVTWAFEMAVAGMHQSFEKPDSGPPFWGVAVKYQCTPDTLTIQGLHGLGPDETTFTRFAEATP